jgi:tripartite-type tricarboxylate transporter receptor subunit TctC
VTQRFSSQGVDLIASSPGEAEAHMKEQLARWGKVVKEAGVTAE